MQTSMLGNYSAGAVWDELVTGTGRLRPHWRRLMGRLAPLDRDELAELREETGRLFRQNGVAYTIYGDPKAAERPWPLDLIPMIIPADEWRVIDAGATQRARLLNAVLADIYGARRLVAQSSLPPSLLHANPSFLRPGCDIAPPGGIYLHLYAVDLARSPDGRWWVLADRLQAPSGAGYALENRTVVGRVLADCIAGEGVEPIAPFFATLRDSLCALAPGSRAGSTRTPRLVLLTPGPYNETYFEHAYLARQLGVTLVEGADLTIRDRRVFLKTLSALEPIDVILRRLDDDFCDPLELRAQSTLGIAGLAEAARAGNVTIANALGSGVLEGMAFKPFLPGLSQALLGEPPVLPDVASWWCGGEKECRYVLEHLDQLVIKPAFPTLGLEPVFGAELSTAERESLAARIADRPLDFVGQERVELSTVPVAEDGRMVPRPLVLRVFVAATPAGFAVMPGGLTRTSPADGPPIVSMQRGGGCKDTWVLGAAASGRRLDAVADSAKIVSLRQPGIRRPFAGELPSRAADGLFWVGRYTERAGSAVMLLRTVLLGITDAAAPWTQAEAEPVLQLAGALNVVPALAFVGARAAMLELIPLIHAAVNDAANPHGLPGHLRRLAIAVAGVRDHLPFGCWQIIAALTREPAPRVQRPLPAPLLLRLDELAMLGAALWGTVDDTMQRDAGWRFLDMGKRLERAIGLMAIVHAAAAVSRHAEADGRRLDQDRLLAAMLTAAGMRRTVPGRPDGTFDRPAALAALFINDSDPFSLDFQIAAVSGHLGALPRPGAATTASANAVSRALELVQTSRSLLAAALGEGRGGSRTEGMPPSSVAMLQTALAPLQALLPEISNLLTRAYFDHVVAQPA
jgi:uncharacterized circularly permuted ATP-grasp superfamily protein/uncharacterized alpha-E superfamily protein